MFKNLLAVAAISLAAAGAAQAQVVDFESVALGSYSSFTSGGITFSGSLTVSDDDNGPFVNAPAGTHFLDNRFGGTPFTFTFSSTDLFGMQIGATNAVQTFSAFDSGNNLLGSILIPDQVGTMPSPYNAYYQLNFAGMTKATLTANVGDWILIDNVTAAGTVQAVPEPGTYALMALGLAVVGFAARRRSAVAK